MGHTRPCQTETQIDKSDHTITTHTHKNNNSTDVECVLCTFAVLMASDPMRKHHGPGPLGCVDLIHKTGNMCVHSPLIKYFPIGLMHLAGSNIPHNLHLSKYDVARIDRIIRMQYSFPSITCNPQNVSGISECRRH